MFFKSSGLFWTIITKNIKYLYDMFILMAENDWFSF